MSSGDVRKVSRQDIQLVQNLIERCLQRYMNQKEVVDTLLYQEKIDPGFTELVWQKLEEENREFFKAYHVRLLLKNQILVFNKLLEKQIDIMHKALPPAVASVPHSNGSGSSTLHRTPPSYLSDHASTSSRPDTLFSNGGSPSSMMNGSSTGNQSIQLPNGASILVGSSQNSHTQRPNGTNGTTIKSEPSYSNNSDFPFCNDGSFLDTQVPIESCSELNEQPLNESLINNDTSSYVFLSQIPQSFSFLDLTDDFTQSADILQNYGRSPYLEAEPHNFSDSSRREYEEEDRRLDTISEGVSFDDFGSE